MTRRLPALPEEVQRLLDAEQRAGGAPPGARARVWGRVASTAPGTGIVSGGVWKGVATIVAVAAMSAAGWLSMGGEAERDVRNAASEPGVTAPEAGALPEPPLSIATPVEAVVHDIPTRKRPSRVPPKQAPPAPELERSLEAEYTLIAAARSSLKNGELDVALLQLQRHGRDHPAGLLIEERDALWVQLFAAQGDVDAAGEAAAFFATHYPHSPLRDVVERAASKETP